MQYKKVRGFLGGSETCIEKIIDTGETLSIPFDEANTDYQAYLAWLAEGNTPNPYIPPPETAPLTPQEKLAAAGLSVDELKSLLGIK